MACRYFTSNLKLTAVEAEERQIHEARKRGKVEPCVDRAPAWVKRDRGRGQNGAIL